MIKTCVFEGGPHPLKIYFKFLGRFFPGIRIIHFPECVARVPVSLWGSGRETVFAKCCVCARNRSQPSATVRVRTVRLSKVCQFDSWQRLCGNATEVVSKVCQFDSWCRSYIGVCRGGVSVSDLWRGNDIGVCRGVCVSNKSVLQVDCPVRGIYNGVK